MSPEPVYRPSTKLTPVYRTPHSDTSRCQRQRPPLRRSQRRRHSGRSGKIQPRASLLLKPFIPSSPKTFFSFPAMALLSE
jgi:hypothetical protein